MKHVHLIAIVCLIMSSAGCTLEPENSDLLIGQWSDCDSNEDTFVFGGDGSYAFDESGEDADHVTGTYEADGTTVLVVGQDDSGTDVEMEFTYYANDANLVLAAAYPQAEHDGVIGIWKSRMRSVSSTGTFGSDSTMELRADNTGTLTQVPFDGSAKFESEGTWGPDEDENNIGGFELEMAQDNFTLSVSFQLVDNAVLGSPTFCRITPL